MYLLSKVHYDKMMRKMEEEEEGKKNARRGVWKRKIF